MADCRNPSARDDPIKLVFMLTNDSLPDVSTNGFNGFCLGCIGQSDDYEV